VCNFPAGQGYVKGREAFIDNDRIVEEWNTFDGYHVRLQMGALAFVD